MNGYWFAPIYDFGRFGYTAAMNEPSKPYRLRWFQYRLRSLFVLMFLVSIGMSWFSVNMQRAKKQKEAVEEIKNPYWWVLYDYEVDAAGKRILGAVPLRTSLDAEPLGRGFLP